MSLIWLENTELLNHPRYRTYVSTVDKALKAFESTNEWADLISALGKLNKVLQSNSKFRDVPKPVVVAKRLSQCLNLHLPSGVHLKALETYRQIFEMLGPTNLSKTLFLYSVGLFPLMGYAGIKVKMELFSLFEKYLVPLGPSFRPATTAFLTGLLPALEEGSEFYDRCDQLLGGTMSAVGADYFMSCIWQSVLASPSVRLPALTFVASQFDKKKPMDDQAHILGNSIDLMVSALCAAVEDDSTLVQRQALDFLCIAFPLSTEHLVRSDKVRLVRHSLSIVLRRDMSLNRRLYSWLSARLVTASEVDQRGKASDNNAEIGRRFRRQVLPVVVDAIKSDMYDETKGSDEHSCSAKRSIKIARLLLYFLDRAELGPVILDGCLIHLLMFVASKVEVPTRATMRTRRRRSAPLLTRNPKQLHLQLEPATDTLSSKSSITNSGDEVGPNLNMLLAAVGEEFIWNYLGDVLEDSEGRHRLSPFAYREVVEYCLSAVTLNAHSTIRAEHLPALLRRVLLAVQSSCPHLPTSHLLCYFNICLDLIFEIQQSSSAVVEQSLTTSAGACVTEQNTGQKLMRECIAHFGRSLISILDRPSIGSSESAELLSLICDLFKEFTDFPIYQPAPLDRSGGLLQVSIPSHKPAVIPRYLAAVWRVALNELESIAVTFDAQAKLIDLLVYLALRCQSIVEQHAEYEKRLLDALAAEDGETETRPTTATFTSALLLVPILDTSCLAELERQGFYKKAAALLWKHLDADVACDNQAAARLLSILHSRDLSGSCEDVCVAELTHSNLLIRLRAIKRFRTLWVLLRNGTSEDLHLLSSPPQQFVRALFVMMSNVTNNHGSATVLDECKEWFRDCVQHGDLPKILQIYCYQLLDARTARVSIQYLSRSASVAGSGLPEGAMSMALSLVNNPGSFLHHLTASGRRPAAVPDELRRRLLTEESSFPVVAAEIRDTFDQESQDVSLYGESDSEDVELAVAAVVKQMLDVVCGAEEEPKEMEAVALADLPPAPSVSQAQEHRRQESVISTLSMDSVSSSELRCFDEDDDSPVASSRSRSAVEGRAAKKPSPPSPLGPAAVFHQVHAHLLLYVESAAEVDLECAERLFRSLADLLLSADPQSAQIAKLVASCMASSGTANLPKGTMSGYNGRQSVLSFSSFGLAELLHRHIRSVLSYDFWEPDSAAAADGSGGKAKNYTFLELLLTISLYYLRSYFLNSSTAACSYADLRRNVTLKIACLCFLERLIRQLAALMRQTGGGTLAAYLQEMLIKCKVQKCLLHCLVATVKRRFDECGVLSVDIIEFNEWEGDVEFDSLLSSFEKALLALTTALVELEHEIKRANSSTAGVQKGGAAGTVQSVSSSGKSARKLEAAAVSSVGSAAASVQVPMVQLRTFVFTCLKALKDRHRHHCTWLDFIVRILPYVEKSLPHVSLHVVEQLCKNLEMVTQCSYNGRGKGVESIAVPTNYACLLLESMTTILHYSLVDSAAQHGGGQSLIATSSGELPTTASSHSAGQSSTATAALAAVGMMPVRAASEVFGTLVRAFTFGDVAAQNALPLPSADKFSVAHFVESRKVLLNALPHSLSTLCELWSAIKNNAEPSCPVGTPQLRRLILDLLSPIAVSHPSSFLTSAALVWLSRGSRKPTDDVLRVYSAQQHDIADLLLSVKVLPLETLITALGKVLKEPSRAKHVADRGVFPVDVPLLEVLHGCLTASPVGLLKTCSQPLLQVYSDVLAASPGPFVVYVLFTMYAEYVRLCGGGGCVSSVVDGNGSGADGFLFKSHLDMCQRVVEAVNNIVGWQLEQSNWLFKRAPTVRSAFSSTFAAGDSMSKSEHATPCTEESLANGYENSSSVGTTSGYSSAAANRGSVGSLASGKNSNLSAGQQDVRRGSAGISSSPSLPSATADLDRKNPLHSRKALWLLAKHLATTFESIFRSEDKEKLLPTLQNVWANVLPYLKLRSSKNANNFLAASTLLKSISGYSYTRPIWRKATFDLLFDANFFRADVTSMKCWLTTVDHLMSQDKAAFKELLAKISAPQGAALSSLITSKENEYEMRSAALKRLAFVLFSSPLDQYQPYLPEIQEKLTECLKLYQVPHVHCHVFLCFRVLAVKLTPEFLTSLWPILVSELVQVTYLIEQQLSKAGNKYKFARADQWLALYLSACKLLEALTLLPPFHLNQFQMYQWAFSPDVALAEIESGRTDIFLPHAVRISRLLAKRRTANRNNNKSLKQADRGYASVSHVKALDDLAQLDLFFESLSSSPFSANRRRPCSSEFADVLAFLEEGFLVDFADGFLSS